MCIKCPLNSSYLRAIVGILRERLRGGKREGDREWHSMIKKKEKVIVSIHREVKELYMDRDLA